MKILVFFIVLAALIYIGTTRNEEKKMQELGRAKSVPTKKRPASATSQSTRSYSSNSTTTDSPQSTLEKGLQSVAVVNNVRVRVVNQQGKSLRVHVEWTSDVATLGGDYIMALFRENIIKDFDAVDQGHRNADQSGRSVWSQDYELKLR